MANMNSKQTIQTLCRTCIGEGDHNKAENKQSIVSIFGKTERLENNITFLELLKQTTPQLNIEKDDVLPKLICEFCIDRLIKANEFQKMCVRSEQKLKEFISEQTPNDTNLMKSAETPNDKTNCIDDDFTVSNSCDIDFDESATDTDYVPSISEDDLNYASTSSDGDQFNERNSASKSLSNSKIKTSQEVEKLSYQFECDECGSRLKTRKSLVRHKKIHLRPLAMQTEKPTKITTGDHFNTENSANKSISNTKIRSSQEVEKLSYQFECDECGSRLKTRKSLGRHKKIHQRPFCKQTEKPTIITTKKIHECEYCKKVFQKPSLLNDHIRLHTGELPYQCDDCGKSFRKASTLKQHLLRHGPEKSHLCPDCPKSFYTSSDLSSHKAVHNETKSHICEVCGAGFVKAFYLKEHKMYHTGEKNHKCTYCNRSFVTGYQCRRHMRTHTGEKPHKCKYCEKSFAQSNDLMKHLRNHLGDNVYRCSLCPQGFPLDGDLRKHFNTHKNDNEETKLRNLHALKEEELRLEIKFGLPKGT